MVRVYAEKSMKLKLDATIVFVTIEQIENRRFNFDNSEISSLLCKKFRDGVFDGKLESFAFFNVGKPVLAVGLGEEKVLNETDIRIAVKHALSNKLISGCKSLEIVPHKESEKIAAAYAEGILIGSYLWEKYKSEKSKKEIIAKIVSKYSEKVKETEIICSGVNFARDLVNENSDVKNSELLEKVVYDISKNHREVKVRVLGERELENLGMNLFLAVNRGSMYAPKLIIVEYTGGKRDEEYTAFVGKGITFDTGGINLKPSGWLEDMRLDMAGTAAVIGTLKNILYFKPKKNLIFACAVAENMISQTAYKPGDVYIGFNGKSVEIGNTDAEGRLVLADSLAYITEKYNVKRVIDIATLTGAELICFANDFSAIVSNNNKLSEDIIESGKETDDRIWPMPCYKELASHIKSEYADIKNIGLPHGHGGVISAAEFLRNFVKEGVDWAHLDIAGPAFINQKEYWYYNYGATGAGVRVVTNYLLKCD